MSESEPLLHIKDLCVDFKHKDGVFHAVKDVSLTLNKGETLSLIGESGSGKSVTALSILQLLPSTAASHPKGSILYKGQEVIGMKPAQLQNIRGKEVGMIFQEPMTSLNPLHTIGKQIAEILSLHTLMTTTQIKERVLELMDLVQMPNMKERLNAYPHELSGGQRQRVMIAMALANNPDLLIADEPTTALDVTVQAEILKLLHKLKDELEMAMLFISHDLNLVRHISDSVCVMKDGVIREQGKAKTIFEKPKDTYTKSLLDAHLEGLAVTQDQTTSPVILDVKDIQVTFALEKNFFGKPKRELKAVDHVNVSLRKGHTLGIVGESGSGKTTLGMALLRLQSAKGTALFHDVDILALSQKAYHPYRSKLQIVFQDPFGSLSPRMSIAQIIAEGLDVHYPELTEQDIETRVIQTLKDVEMDPDIRHRYPHEFSGGQRQRIAIARALIMEPELIILDEPTSALDMAVQVSILTLLKKLQKEKGLTYIFITHDLRVIRAIAHDILVMRNGQVVETGETESIFNTPKDPYTQKLFEAAFLKNIAA